MAGPGDVSRNDSTQRVYLNRLTGEYPYTGYKPKKEQIDIKYGDSKVGIEAKFSSKVSQPKSFSHSLDCENPAYVTPGSLPKRRARDFFNELEKKGYAKQETIEVSSGNSFVDFLFGTDKVPVYSVKMPKNENGAYPNLKYFMELTNLPEKAFLNLPKEALEHPEKYVLKGTVHIDANMVNDLWN